MSCALCPTPFAQQHLKLLGPPNSGRSVAEWAPSLKRSTDACVLASNNASPAQRGRETPYQLVGRHSGLPACCGGAASGPARDGWPPASALALLVKMAAVSIAATVVQSYSAQAPLVCRLLSHFAHARAARPASLREGMSLPRFDPAAKSCSLEPRPTLGHRGCSC